MATENPDDALTLSAMGALAFIIADVTHEGLGHGLAALAVGAKPVIFTTCYFATQGNYSRWIPAAGGLANVCAGLLSLLLLRIARLPSPRFRCFLVLVAAFNLLFAAAYPAYSGIALFGDWAGVISGLEPAWFWRVLLVFASVAGYFLSLVLLAHAIRPFCGSNEPQALQRLRRVTLIPYRTAIGVALLGGIPNPSGWMVILSAAVPAAAAAVGLTELDHFSAATTPHAQIAAAGVIECSRIWIAAAIAAAAVFVSVLGPGIRFH